MVLVPLVTRPTLSEPPLLPGSLGAGCNPCVPGCGWPPGGGFTGIDLVLGYYRPQFSMGPQTSLTASQLVVGPGLANQREGRARNIPRPLQNGRDARPLCDEGPLRRPKIAQCCHSACIYYISATLRRPQDIRFLHEKRYKTMIVRYACSVNKKPGCDG